MIYAMIQARMGSTRLPGKVMKDIMGSPILEHLINRVKSSEMFDDIIVVSSDSPENRAISDFCKENNVNFFAGNEEDVLDRFYQAGLFYNLKDDDIIIRITGDCPLIDPLIIDNIINQHVDENNDYTSNVIIRSFPDGLDCEVFNFSVLKDIWEKSNLKSEREHVTLYIRNNLDSYKIGDYVNDNDLSNLRWTLDEKEDFIFINSIYEKLFDKVNLFSTSDILDLLEREPELVNINNMYECNEGLSKSLKEDMDLGSRHVNQ